MTTATKDDDVKKRLRKGGRGITLKYDGECADCGAFLAKGTTARWYGRGRIYGYTCHSKQENSDRKPEPKAGAAQGDLFGRDSAQEPTEQENTTGEYIPKKYNCSIR